MIHDITPPISEALQVWPKDMPPRREVLTAPCTNVEAGAEAEVTTSALHATVHLGAHLDAPSHYAPGAPTIDQRPLDDFLGPCQVMHVPVQPGARLRPAQLPGPVAAPRVLLATGTYPDPTCFNRDFAALSPELIDFLGQRHVRLVGIDTPSVDLFSDRNMSAHRRCLAHDMNILEGLRLGDVPDGLYELIALPLKLVGFEASPVRAVLRTLD